LAATEEEKLQKSPPKEKKKNATPTKKNLPRDNENQKRNLIKNRTLLLSLEKKREICSTREKGDSPDFDDSNKKRKRGEKRDISRENRSNQPSFRKKKKDNVHFHGSAKNRRPFTS